MAALVKLRTKITENQKEILLKFFDEGMISKGKEKAEYHNKAAQETGLDINVVKEWVGNHAKKLSGRKYTYGSRTAVHSKGVSAYNLYVKETRDSLGPMSTWAESWNMLSPTEKGEYAERAAVIKDQAVLNPARAIKQMIKEIHSRLEILQQLGVDLAVIGIENGSEVVCGTGLVHSYICQKPEIMQDLRSFLLRDAATGVTTGFNYNKVIGQTVEVSGLPESVMPLKHLSHYGVDKLKQILAVQKIQVINRLQTTSSLSTPVEVAPTSNCTSSLTTPVEVAPTSDSTSSLTTPVEVAPTSDSTSSLTTPVEVAPTLDSTSTLSTPVEVAPTSDSTSTLSTPVEVAPTCDISYDEWMETQATTFISLMTKQEAVETTTDIFTVETLLDERKVGRKVQYLVKWEGYLEPTWEDKRNIIDKSLLKNFKKQKIC
ncbi:uncharacterized protein LOC127839529 [Dreissena polymorpha]|uniref:uncharacterized protein LOC127839529 n=1 Tax=Dreissena polymorpha TaxID=45954 RepID=UPI002264C799|nr:uncharacterized protein LOC127839529 [Dreissena polymorpha]